MQYPDITQYRNQFDTWIEAAEAYEEAYEEAHKEIEAARQEAAEQAIPYYQEAIAIARQQQYVGEARYLLGELGLTLSTLERYGEAEDALREAIAIQESQRTNLDDENKIAFGEGGITRDRDYKVLQEVLVAQGKTDEALEIAERGRARAMVDLLTGEISDQSGREIIVEAPTIAAIRQIAQQQNATVVNYSVINDWTLYVWVVQPNGTIYFETVNLRDLIDWDSDIDSIELDRTLDGLIASTRQTLNVRSRNDAEAITSPTPEAQSMPRQRQQNAFQTLHRLLVDPITEYLTKAVNLWDLIDWDLNIDSIELDQTLGSLVASTHQTLNVRSPNDAEAIISPTPEAQSRQRQRQQEALQTLHRLLIDPIAAYLPNNPEDQIIFIPHQSLYLAPFPALMDTNGDYLIERHTMLTAPSIQVLDLIRRDNPLNVATLDPQEMLVVGNPIMPSLWNPASGQSEQLASLPGTEAEVFAIQDLFGVSPLLGETATEATVRAQMPNARVIHLATHGLLDYGNRAETGVLDFPGAVALTPGNGEDGLLTAAEILQMDLSADLVVLSACDTGRGRITEDGVVGLSRAFMQAGVPSLMVSLWKVPDEPTAFLMEQFYQNWQTNPDRVQALRQAMLATMAMNEHSDPINWAAFTVVGQTDHSQTDYSQ
ncbi:MAG: CHAT domain-containing protein [Leptolyngbyaceae cyanobacterium]